MAALTDPALTVIKKWNLPGGKHATAYQFQAGVGPATFSIADEHAQDANVALALWCHGSGGGPRKLHDSTAGWVPWRDGLLAAGAGLLEAGGSLTSVFGGTQNWNRAFARPGYSTPAQTLRENWMSYNRVLIAGTSMGAGIAVDLATRDPYLSPLCIGLLHSAGIYNYAAEFDQGVLGDGKDRFDLAKYYGTEWPDRPSFIAATADRDPARMDPAEFDGLPVFIIVGDADKTAVKERAGEQFWLRFKPGSAYSAAHFAPESRFVVVPGADHATQSMYQDPRMLEWSLERIGVATAPSTSGVIYEVTNEAMMDSDGLVYATRYGTYTGPVDPNGPPFLIVSGREGIGSRKVAAAGSASIIDNENGTATVTGPVVDPGNGSLII
jgi:hypothetical protein